MAAESTLLLEAESFEGPLLGDVLDLGRCPDPVRRGVGEEIVDMEALGCRSSALSSFVWIDDDPVLPCARSGSIGVASVHPSNGPVVVGGSTTRL